MKIAIALLLLFQGGEPKTKIIGYDDVPRTIRFVTETSGGSIEWICASAKGDDHVSVCSYNYANKELRTYYRGPYLRDQMRQEGHEVESREISKEEFGLIGKKDGQQFVFDKW